MSPGDKGWAIAPLHAFSDYFSPCIADPPVPFDLPEPTNAEFTLYVLNRFARLL